jgi:hypothetical protein
VVDVVDACGATFACGAATFACGAGVCDRDETNVIIVKVKSYLNFLKY